MSGIVPKEVERLSPAVTAFLDENIPVLRDNQGKTLVSRAYLVSLFLDTRGQGGMKLQIIKREITIWMNYRFDKWTSVRKGVKGGVWIIRGQGSVPGPGPG
jgi:hypothetical protein